MEMEKVCLNERMGKEKRNRKNGIGNEEMRK